MLAGAARDAPGFYPARRAETAHAPPAGPEADGRWYTVQVTASRAETISAVFGQAERRDPGHARPWIALVDGDRHQIEVIRAQAPPAASRSRSWPTSSTCWNTCGRPPGVRYATYGHLVPSPLGRAREVLDAEDAQWSKAA